MNKGIGIAVGLHDVIKVIPDRSSQHAEGDVFGFVEMRFSILEGMSILKRTLKDAPEKNTKRIESEGRSAEFR